MNNYNKAFEEAFEPVKNLKIVKHTIFLGALVCLEIICILIWSFNEVF